MGLTPEGEDLTRLTAHIRPLAHQASEGLRLASDDLRRSADRASDVLGERLAIPWSVVLHRILVVLRSARHLRRMTSVPATWSRYRWLLLVTLVAGVTALAATAIAAVLRSRRAGASEAAAVTAPVVIPVSLTADQDATEDERVAEALRSA
jgi:hypothetical protein